MTLTLDALAWAKLKRACSLLYSIFTAAVAVLFILTFVFVNPLIGSLKVGELLVSEVNPLLGYGYLAAMLFLWPGQNILRRFMSHERADAVSWSAFTRLMAILTIATLATFFAMMRMHHLAGMC